MSNALPRSAWGDGDASFPELEFPCAGEEETGRHAARVALGRERMGGSRAVICGLARDLGDGVHRTLRQIEALMGMFAEGRAVLYENDSRDGTRRALEAWSRVDPRVTLLCESLGAPRFGSVRCMDRASRMADYRNRVHAEALARYADFDFAVVVDTDLELGWSFDGIASSFGHDDWDAIGSNGVVFQEIPTGPSVTALVCSHFDSWAFRHVGHPQPHTDAEIQGLRFQRGAPLFRVISCFGGAAVYRMEAFRAAVYDGGDCEHVPFHKEMARAGFDRIYLNPSQIVVYGPLPARGATTGRVSPRGVRWERRPRRGRGGRLP